MASLRRYLSYLLLALILVLAISACVRPFGQSEAEQAEQATQEAEAQAATQVAEQVQAEEETADASEEAAEPESEAAETVPVEPEAGTDEEVAESEEAAPSDTEVDEGTTDTEEAPAVIDEAESEEAPSAEETAEEAAAEGEMTSEPEAEEPMQTTLPATHTVAPGENLFRIGLKYGMSWIPLAVYNNIPNANLIYTGQVIRIPGGQAPPTQTAPEGATYTNYVVKPGDTLFRISRAFGVSPEEIVKANGLINPNLIYAGQVLKIPTS